MPFHSLPDGEIHYEIDGDGDQAILFIHGYGGGSEDWREQVAALRNNSKCIRLDLRGHGASKGFSQGFDIRSFASDVLSLIRALALRPVVLVGHSMGTRIALEATLQDPDGIAGLVLVDGSCVPDDPAVVQNRVSAEIHDMGYEKFAERTFEDMILAGLGESTRQHILARAKLLPPEIALDLNAAMADWDSTRFASALSAAAVPIAVVQSTSITGVEDWRRCKVDREPNSLWLDSWSRQPGSVNIVTVPDTGHFIMLEHPEIIVEAIRTVVKVLSA